MKNPFAAAVALVWARAPDTGPDSPPEPDGRRRPSADTRAVRPAAVGARRIAGPSATGWPVPTRLALTAAFVAVALTLLSLVFDYGYKTGCTSVASWKFCMFSQDFVGRALAVIVTFSIFIYSNQTARRRLQAALSAPAGLAAIALPGGIGAALLALPIALWGLYPEGGALLASVSLWAAAVAFLALAALRSMAPFGVWRDVLRAGGVLLWGLLLLAVFLPDIIKHVVPIWHVESIRDTTFAAVSSLSALIDLDLEFYPQHYVVGQGDFYVRINQSCSGIEGLVLTTAFLSGYAVLFRQQVHVWRVLLVLPLALALSLCLNVVRITLLLWIGMRISPVLAVEGFHSHAGWLMFSVLALSLILVIHTIGWFHKLPAADGTSAAQNAGARYMPQPAFLDDWNVARILPFALFMFSALLASTFFQSPAAAYPLRFAALALALYLIAPHLRGLAWRIDGLAVLGGVLIAIGWIVSAPLTSPPDPVLEQMAAVTLAVWVLTRIIGTTFLVPITEELFFRSYLLERFNLLRSPAGPLLAVALSTLAFAVLHDRWFASGVAGLVFASLVLRPNGRLADAIVAHMIANGLIALWALRQGDWTMI